jgi:hypothetical protein
MNFSSILDIGSFFIGIIINLLFVALVCYYFKRKYELLEKSQMEQGRMIYTLLQKEKESLTLKCEKKEVVETTKMLANLNEPLLNKRNEPQVNNDVSDNDADDDDTSSLSEEEEDDEEEEEDVEIKEEDISHYVSNTYSPLDVLLVTKLEDPSVVETMPLQIDEITEVGGVEEIEGDGVKHIHVDDPEKKKNNDDGQDFNKMSMKQLKELMTTKGIKVKSNVTKHELIEQLSKDKPGSLYMNL